MTGDSGEVQRWREQLATLPAGPALAAAIAAPPTGIVEPAAQAAASGDLISDVQRAAAVLDRIVARRRLLSTWQAQEISDIALLTAVYPFPLEDLPTELGQALTLTDGQAHRLLADADTYTHRLTATLDAWTTGDIAAHAAAAILDATATTTDDIAGRVEALVLPHAGSRTSDQTWTSARRRVLRLDPDATRRHQIAATTRCVTRRALPDGMALRTRGLAAPDDIHAGLVLARSRRRRANPARYSWAHARHERHQTPPAPHHLKSSTSPLNSAGCHPGVPAEDTTTQHPRRRCGRPAAQHVGRGPSRPTNTPPPADSGQEAHGTKGPDKYHPTDAGLRSGTGPTALTFGVTRATASSIPHLHVSDKAVNAR